MPAQIYVTDYNLHIVSIFAPNGTLIRQFRGEGSSDGHFDTPWDLFVYKKEIYVADTRHGKIKIFDLEGNYKREWNVTTPGDTQNWWVFAIWISNDELFAAAAHNIPPFNQVMVFSLDGVFKREWGPYGEGPGEFIYAWGISATETNVYVSGWWNHKIAMFDLNGGLIKEWGTQGSLDGQFSFPNKHSIYKKELWVAEYLNHRVQMFDLDGNYKRKWGTYGEIPGTLSFPMCVAAMGNLVFVGSATNDLLQSFDPNGIFKKQYNTHIIAPYGVKVTGGMIDYLPIVGVG